MNTPIARVVFMRLGSATHGFDGDQRYVSVPFTQARSTLTVSAPPDSTIALPGYYMLWLVDARHVPCRLAPFVRLSLGWRSWFAVHPETKAGPGATVTALWAPRQPEHLDLFTTTSDGTVWSTWWGDY